MATSSKKRLKIVITGGGTGGHIYPALAVAEALKSPAFSDKVESLLYIGNEGSLESKLVPAQGIAFQAIRFHGMPRKISFSILGWFIELLQAIQHATTLLKAMSPDVVFGTGGYVSAPVLLAAKLLSIPYVIHEPDAQPGLVNRLTSRWAKRATAAFEVAGSSFPKAIPFEATGNPVRGTILTIHQGTLSQAEARQKLDLPVAKHSENHRLVLLVTGGSQGAQTLNQAVAQTIDLLIGEFDLIVLHQTGAKGYEDTLSLIPEAFRNHPQYRIAPYFDNMAEWLAASDLALCRAGSLTLSEMMLAGLPTILVPYPYAAGDHQRKNAEAAVQAGASLMIEDSQCNRDSLIKAIGGLITHKDRFKSMQAAARQLARPHATQLIVTGLLQ